MKKISYWARNNKKQARFLIIASFILLTGLGIAIGGLLNEMGIIISPHVMLLFAGAYLLALAVYPSMSPTVKKRNTPFHYLRQKSCDFLLAASSVCMVVYFSNQPQQLFQHYTMVSASMSNNASLPNDSILKTYKSLSDFSLSLKDESGKSLSWKAKKKLLKQQVKGIKKANDLSAAEKTALVILAVLVATGLLILVASAACSLSCAGSEGAAVLVGLGGTALVIFLVVIVIRAIYGKKRSKRKELIRQEEMKAESN